MSFLRALLSAVASGAAAGGVRPPPLEEGKPVTVQNDRDTVLLNAAAQRIARGRGDEGEQTPDELQAFSALTPSEQLAKVEEELEQLPPRQRREVMDLLGKWLGRKFIPNPGPQAQAYHSKADILLFGGAAGGGKQLRVDELIPVPVETDPSGFKRMGDIVVGDYVFGSGGYPVAVVAVAGVDRAPDAYAVEFDSGEVIEADARHLWVTWTDAERMRVLRSSDEWRAKRRASRPSRAKGDASLKPWLRDVTTRLNQEREYKIATPMGGVRTTAEIAETLYANKAGRLNHSVDVAPSIVGTVSDLPVEPYLFGLWLGDGDSSAGAICMDGADWADIAHHVPEPMHVRVDTRPPRVKPFVRKSFKGLQRSLRLLGVLGSKRIPPIYLRASYHQRVALLQGILDTDGHCSRDKGSIEIGLSNRALAEDVAELVASLGIRARLKTKATKCQVGAGADSHRLHFMAPFVAFRMSRKAALQKLSGFRPSTTRRYITSVRPCEPTPMRCIQVAAEDGVYLVGRSFIPTHNSQLLIGLAMQEHQRSLILRREYGQLLGLTESALKMHGSREGFVKSPEPILKTADRRTIRFGAAQHPGDEEKYQGYARDFLGLDEAAHFTELQVRTLSGWVRTEDRKQRTRVVLASNPPMSAEGQWMIDMFGPWLNPNYPNPAKPGELRWFISDETGKDQEVPGGEPVRVGGKMVSPISRTFIPSKLADNIYYVETGYEKILDAMPEPMRTAMREGNFMAFRQDDLFQVIPVAWIREAMARWTPNPPPGQRMTCMGVDVALGGQDQTAIATRRGMWFAKPIVIPGAQTPSASFVVGQVTQHLRDGALVAVDVGGGYGIDTVARLKDLGLNCAGYNGAESSTASPSGSRLTFANKRAQAWWAFREALNPDNGVGVMLPPDTDLEADLTAPQWDPVAMERRGVYQVETKDQIRKRLSRSPDRGDAVVISWFAGPSPEQEHKAIHAAKPTVNLGYSHVKVVRGYGNAKSYGGRR